MPTPRPPRPWTALALLLAVALLAAQGPVLVGARTWSDDHYVAEVVPARLAAVDAIADGRLPGWWERAGFGAPLWSEPADAAAYPGYWPAALAPGHAAWLIDVIGTLHVLAAALGVALLARRLGADDLGALVAGAWFAVSDVAIGGVLGGAIGAVAWLPWAAWAGGELASRRLRGFGVLAVAIAMMVLAGRWTIAIDGALLGLVFAARGRGAGLAWAGGAAALGVGLAAIALVPAIVHVTGDTVGAPAPPLSGWALAELVMPHARELGDGGSAGGVWIGGAALALAAIAALRGARLPGLAAIAFAVGTISNPDHAAAAAVLIAALAGVGFAAARDARTIVIAILALGVGVAALGAARPMLVHHLGGDFDASVARVDSVLTHAALASAIAAAALGLLLFSARLPAAAPAAAVLVLSHAVIVARLAHPTVPRSDLDDAPTLLQNLRISEPLNGLSSRLYRPLDMPDSRDPHESLAAAVATRFGFAAVRWPAPGRRAIEDALWLASSTGGRRMLDRFAIDLAMMPAGSATDLTELGERGGNALVETGAKRTRAFLAPATRWFPDDAAAIAAMFPIAGTNMLALGAVARVGQGSDAGPDDASPIPCDVRAPRPEHVIVHCDGDGGTIALADAWAPGWSVTVDGAPAELARVDVLARGVEVPPGAHVAEFEYHAPDFELGRWISLASLFALAAIVALRWRRS